MHNLAADVQQKQPIKIEDTKQHALLIHKESPGRKSRPTQTTVQTLQEGVHWSPNASILNTTLNTTLVGACASTLANASASLPPSFLPWICWFMKNDTIINDIYSPQKACD